MVLNDFVHRGRGPLPPRRTRATGGITMAFQPIADLELRTTFACEALLRGDGGAGAYEVLDRIPRSERCAFDEACWDTAFALTTELDLRTALSLNVHPSTFARGGLRNVLLAARHFAFPPDRLILELTEDEWVSDVDLIQASREEARAAGVRVALDDLGAGFAGLNLLADLQPDLVKLDRGLVRGIDSSRPRRAIVKGVLAACRDSGVEVIAEGVEGVGELSAVWDLGIRYVQGYLLARPAVAALPAVAWPPELVERGGKGSARHAPLTAAAGVTPVR